MDTVSVIGITSIAAAALCMAIGSIGPAMGEAKAIAQALRIDRAAAGRSGNDQPDAVHRPGDDRIDRDLLLRDRDHSDLRQSVLESRGREDRRLAC